MELILVRHGEPAGVLAGRTVADPGLSDRGRRQAEAVARRLAAHPPDAVWVSDARRALETAAPLLARTGHAPQVHPWLHEVRAPTLDDRDPAEVDAFLAARRQAPVPDWWAGLPGCEPVREFTDRVTTGLDEALAALGGRRHDGGGADLWTGLPDARVVLVCHAGTAGVAIAHLLGLGHVPWPWERFGLDHGALAAVQDVGLAGARAFTLTRFQDRAHLDPADERR